MDHLKHAKDVISIELAAINKLVSNLDNNFNDACNTILNCKGRIIVIGMGKSGHIGSKIAATFSSTGTPSYFVHPAEAGHGDFGMITKSDAIIAISNSGFTPEVIQLLPLIKRIGVPLISITGKPDSVLAKESDINLNIAIDKEACPYDLAPTASTTTTLVLGDALAIALLKARGFTEEDFAFSHPSGSLGKKLLLKVKDIMKTGTDIPNVPPSATIEDTILEMSSKGLGMTTVTTNEKLLGIFTDGDLRRIFHNNLFHKETPIEKLMTTQPKTISMEELAAKALNVMESYEITSIVVTKENKVEGIIHLHDLLQNGIV